MNSKASTGSGSIYVLKDNDTNTEIKRLKHQAEAQFAATDDRPVLDDISDLVGRDGSGMSFMDVGCGPGIFGTRLCDAYPRCTGFAVDIDREVLHQPYFPSNLRSVVWDVHANKSLPCASGSQHMVRLGTFCGSVEPTDKNGKGWESVFSKSVRALRAGGLLVSVEPDLSKWPVVDPTITFDPSFQKPIPTLSDAESERMAPGFVAFRDRFGSVLRSGATGVSIDPGRTVIPSVMKAHTDLDPSTWKQRLVFVPLSGTSNDPVLKRAGQTMRPNSEMLPEALKFVIKPSLSDDEAEQDKAYKKLSDGFLSHLEDPSVVSGIVFVHNMIRKKGGSMGSTA